MRLITRSRQQTTLGRGIVELRERRAERHDWRVTIAVLIFVAGYFIGLAVGAILSRHEDDRYQIPFERGEKYYERQEPTRYQAT